VIGIDFGDGVVELLGGVLLLLMGVLIGLLIAWKDPEPLTKVTVDLTVSKLRLPDKTTLLTAGNFPVVLLILGDRLIELRGVVLGGDPVLFRGVRALLPERLGLLTEFLRLLSEDKLARVWFMPNCPVRLVAAWCEREEERGRLILSSLSPLQLLSWLAELVSMSGDNDGSNVKLLP
jgi:hypothetical protein